MYIKPLYKEIQQNFWYNVEKAPLDTGDVWYSEVHSNPLITILKCTKTFIVITNNYEGCMKVLAKLA